MGTFWYRLTQVHLENGDISYSCFTRVAVGNRRHSKVVQQNRSQWYGHTLRNNDDCMKMCYFEGEGSHRGRPRKIWKEVVGKDMNDFHYRVMLWTW